MSPPSAHASDQTAVTSRKREFMVRCEAVTAASIVVFALDGDGPRAHEQVSASS